MRALRRHHISFRHAFDGLRWALHTQPNFRVHILCSLFVIWLGYYFNIKSTEMTILIFAIVLGLSAEMINTAIESVTDLMTSKWRKEAKIAKDVSAGMMLLVAFGAIFVAICIFSPYIRIYLHI